MNWTPEEEQFVRECAWAKIPVKQFAKLLDRSPEAVRMKRANLGLSPPGRKLGPRPAGPRSPFSVAEMQQMVATHFGVPVEEMKSPSRKRDYTRPRQVAMFFAREIGHKSYPNIGHMFGGRDHTTVIHGVRAVEELMSKDGEFSHEVTSLLLTLGSAKDNEAGDKSHFLAFATNDAGA